MNQFTTNSGTYRPWLHRWAVLTAATTLLLIVLGALVTSRRAGMIDPQAVRSPWYFFTLIADAYRQDHPTEFLRNHLLNLIEHGHRQVGWIVGVMTIVLAVWIGVSDKRPWMRVLGIVALAAVGGQGLLGILRVSENSLTWAMVHGVSAQCVICLLFAIALFTSRSWTTAEAIELDSAAKWQRLTLWTTLLILAQTIAGVWLRQLGVGLYVHMVLALAVAAHIFMLQGRVSANDGPAANRLRVPVGCMTGILLVQLVLGVRVWWIGGGAGAYDHNLISWERAGLATAHVGLGALLLATSTLTTLRAFHHLRRVPRPAVLLQTSGGAA